MVLISDLIPEMRSAFVSTSRGLKIVYVIAAERNWERRRLEPFTAAKSVHLTEKKTHIEGCDASGGTQMRNMWRKTEPFLGWDGGEGVCVQHLSPRISCHHGLLYGCCNSAAFSRFSVLRLLPPIVLHLLRLFNCHGTGTVTFITNQK